MPIVNHVNEGLIKVFEMSNHFISPIGNGLDEQLNQTLINSPAKFAPDNCDTWDDKLLEVVYAYNTAIQESTKHTPLIL